MTLHSTLPNRCKQCKVRMPADKAHHVIHPDCVDAWYAVLREKQAIARVKAAKVLAAKERKADKEKLASFKTPTQLETECREIVQKMARIRDRNDGCISCHMPAHYDGQWHGSHYRPAGNNAAVQFHLWNIHKSCAQCNVFKGGNLSVYRPRLISKIGIGRVEWLESQNQVVKTSVPYLLRFKVVMGKRLRRIEKQLKGTV